jgi:hypothetical protein
MLERVCCMRESALKVDCASCCDQAICSTGVEFVLPKVVDHSFVSSASGIKSAALLFVFLDARDTLNLLSHISQLHS